MSHWSPQAHVHRLPCVSVLISVFLVAFFSAPAAIANPTDSENPELRVRISTIEHDVHAAVQRGDDHFEAVNTRVSDVLSRINDLTIVLSGFGILAAVLSYFAASQTARKSAEQWMDDHTEELRLKIQKIETQADEAKLVVERAQLALSEIERVKLDASKAAVDTQTSIAEMTATLGKAEQLRSAMDTAQLAMRPGFQGTLPDETRRTIEAAAESTKEKPERSFGFNDWQARGYAAFVDGKYSVAAEYFGNAAEADNANDAQRATALINKGAMLSQQGLDAEALSTFDLAIARFADSKDPKITEPLTKIQTSRGFVLARLGRLQEALIAYDEAIVGYRRLELREPLARVLANKADVQLQSGRFSAALQSSKAANALIAEIGGASLNTTRISALTVEAESLVRMGLSDEALSTFKAIIDEFGTATDQDIVNRLTEPELKWAIALGHFGALEEGKSALRQLVAKHAESKHLIVSKLVGIARDYLEKPTKDWEYPMVHWTRR